MRRPNRNQKLERLHMAQARASARAILVSLGVPKRKIPKTFNAEEFEPFQHRDDGLTIEELHPYSYEAKAKRQKRFRRTKQEILQCNQFFEQLKQERAINGK